MLELAVEEVVYRGLDNNQDSKDLDEIQCRLVWSTLVSHTGTLMIKHWADTCVHPGLPKKSIPVPPPLTHRGLHLSHGKTVPPRLATPRKCGESLLFPAPAGLNHNTDVHTHTHFSLTRKRTQLRTLKPH